MSSLPNLKTRSVKSSSSYNSNAICFIYQKSEELLLGLHGTKSLSRSWRRANGIYSLMWRLPSSYNHLKVSTMTPSLKLLKWRVPQASTDFGTLDRLVFDFFRPTSSSKHNHLSSCKHHPQAPSCQSFKLSQMVGQYLPLPSSVYRRNANLVFRLCSHIQERRS